MSRSRSGQKNSRWRIALSIAGPAIAIPLATVAVLFGAFAIAEAFEYRVPTVLFVGLLLAALGMVRVALFPLLDEPVRERMKFVAVASAAGTLLGWLVVTLLR